MRMMVAVVEAAVVAEVASAVMRAAAAVVG
jgi:hypothetical protein